MAPSKGSAVDVVFDKRTLDTSVLVKSGETVVLGGLIQSQTQETHSKVPLLGDIPILGYLFRSTSSSVNKRNLMVFVHPVILRSDALYSQLSDQKYSWFRAMQLESAKKGLDLLPDAKLPVMPESLGTTVISPEMKKTLEENSAKASDKTASSSGDKTSGKTDDKAHS